MTAPVLDPFEQALRAELQGVTPPDGVAVGVDVVVASGRRVRARRRFAAGVSALVVLALVVLGTALHGARQEAVPAGPGTPRGLTLLTPPEGEVAPSYGVTVGTGSPAVPSQAAATAATVWSKASGRWSRVVDVALDPRHGRSAWVVVPRSSVLIGFVPSSAAQRAVVWRDGTSYGVPSRPTPSAVTESSWSAFVTVPQWTANTPPEPAAPTDLVWWSADRVPVDADGRRGYAVTVDGVPVWMDAGERLWGIQADIFPALAVSVGNETGSGRTGPGGSTQSSVALLPADVPTGRVTATWVSGARTSGTVAELGPLTVLVAWGKTPGDSQVSRVDWTGPDGRTGSYRLL